MGDDAINLHSTAIVPSSGSPDGMTFVFRPGGHTINTGDVLEAIHPETGAIIAKRMVTSVTTLPSGSLEATFDGPFPSISFSTDGKHSTGDQFYNTSEAHNGFLVQNCTFGRFFGRALLLSACQGTVEGNLFNNTAGHFLPPSSAVWGVYWGFNLSLVLSYSPSWGEGPISEQVDILNNTFNGNCNAPSPRIWIYDGVRGGGVATVLSRDTIAIEGNLFTDLISPAVDVGYTSHLILNGNTVQASGLPKAAPRPASAFILSGCPAPVILDNQSTDPAFSTVVEVRP
jgi:hypothetical protein